MKRLKCEKLTDNGRQVLAKAHIAFGKVTLKIHFCLFFSYITKDVITKLYIYPKN
jgi:hypothetical protein